MQAVMRCNNCMKRIGRDQDHTNIHVYLLVPCVHMIHRDAEQYSITIVVQVTYNRQIVVTGRNPAAVLPLKVYFS